VTPAVLFPAHVETWFMLVFYCGGLALGASAFALWKKSRLAALVVGAIAFVFCAVSYDAQSLKYGVVDGAVRPRGGLVPRAPVVEIARLTNVAVEEHGLRLAWDGGSALVPVDDAAGLAAAVNAAR
jgi:hypothetical protein